MLRAADFLAGLYPEVIDRSLLLTGPNVHAGYVRQIINLTQTTSGSYLLMSSLDISRRNLALRGRQVFHQVADMAEYAREEINAVGGYYAFGKELCKVGNGLFYVVLNDTVGGQKADTLTLVHILIICGEC